MRQLPFMEACDDHERPLATLGAMDRRELHALRVEVLLDDVAW